MNANDVLDSVAVGIWVVALVAAFGLLVWQLIDVARSLLVTLTHPFSLSYTGGYLGYYIAHPFQLYQPPDPVPHPTIYPPLVPLLVPKLPGVNVYIWARAVNWLAILGTTTLAGWLTWRRTERPLAVGVTVSAISLSAAIVGQTVLLRVDHIALFLTVAAIAFYDRERRATVGIALLAIAAGFAKQPYAIFAIGPIAASLWFRGYRREAAGFATGTAVVGLALLGVLAALTDGQALVHLIAYNLAVPWYDEVWLSQLYTFLFTHGILVGLAMGVIVTLGRDALESPLTWLFALGGVVALATIGKEGAWIGYFYPVIVASAVLVGDVVREGYLPAEMPTKRRVLSVVVIVALVSQLYLYTLWFPYAEKSLDSQHVTADQLEGAETVLSEEPSVAPGHEPVDVLMVQGLIAGGAIEGDPLADALACGRYEMVATWLPAGVRHQDSRFTEAQLEAIQSNYDGVFPRRGFSLYEYNESGCETPA